jgi:methionine-gamma-lyase
MSEDHLYTTVVHAGESPQAHLGALSTPVYHAAVYAFPDAEQGSAIHEGQQPGFYYGRTANPTQAALENAVCALEGAEAALAVSSGMAAVTTALLTVLKAGDHVVAPAAMYASTNVLLEQILEPFGVEVSYIDGTKVANFANAIRQNTKVLYVESPANPTLSLVDIAGVTALAREHHLTTIMDNTFATPINQRPIELGADLVVHSASKYLGGHSDLIAGVLAGRKDLIQRARWKVNKILGGVISPETAWLVMRGIKTLAVRMERHNANAMIVAKYLSEQPKVQRVYYPGLRSHPQYSLARKQMRGFGGMIAFDVGSIEEGRRLVNNLKLCSLAVSLGDVSTLIQHSASMTHASIPRERRLQVGITDGLLRLSVGIERAEDIVADLDNALAYV